MVWTERSREKQFAYFYGDFDDKVIKMSLRISSGDNIEIPIYAFLHASFFGKLSLMFFIREYIL